MMSPVCNFSLAEITDLAAHHDIPVLDALLIAANSEGTRPAFGMPRVRMQLRPLGGEELWQLILPLDNDSSPFQLTTQELLLNGEPVAAVAGWENDDVVLTYLRAGGRSLTLNTHSRSTCTGCVFCPNVIEDAADGNVNGVDGFVRLLEWVRADNDWTDLRDVEVITVCSGCFHNPSAAITHLSDLRAAASKLQFRGRLHLLSSVIRDKADLERLAGDVGPFHLTLTLECFSRRQLLLKDTKASMTLDEACRIMDDCADMGITADFTYVCGLDAYDIATQGLLRLANHATAFPRIQVFQAHNDYMRRARHSDAANISYFLRLRNDVEGAFAARGLAPRSWENYRPLWYSRFQNGPVAGPRI